MRPSSPPHPQRGASAVEMALLLPVLLVVLFGVIDYSRFFFLRASLTAAVTDAARAATLPGTTDDAIKTLLVNALQDPINQGTGETVAVTITPSEREAGGTVTVTAAVPFTAMVLPQFVGTALFPATLTSSATMVVEP